MQSTWNFRLVTFSRTLPFSFMLMLAAIPSVLAEPIPSGKPASVSSEATALLNAIPEDISRSAEGTQGIPTRKTSVIVSTPAEVVGLNRTQADRASQFPSQRTSLDIAELTQATQETPPETTATPSTQDSSTKPAASTEEAPRQTTTKPNAPSNTPEPAKAKENKAAEPAKNPEAIAREQKLAEADRLYRQGQIAEAEALYREVKDPFAKETDSGKLPESIVDPKRLPPGGQVYWRESQAGLQKQLETRTLVPLKLLVEQYPEFIPGHLRLAEVLRSYDRPKEALAVLEKAATQYPSQPDLLKVTVAAQAESEQWLEAAIAARQFALLNPKHPAAPEFRDLADKNLERYQSDLRGELRENAIAGGLLGVLGAVVTGNPFATLPSIQTSVLLLRGEKKVGDALARRAKRQLKLIEDPAVLNYVSEIGQKLATTTGRNEFEYEFYVVIDERLNAFALPGGKLFVNAGAIIKARSEAELAGLLAHELSHAALSHGFQLATKGTATANVTQLLPFGGLVTNLVVLDYTRDMERQADILGTRVIAASGYAADGLRNLMITLSKEDKDTPFTWLSSHPVTDERIRYLEVLIEQNDYNRYAYEGVERHAQIQARVTKLLAEHKEREAKRKKTQDSE